MAKKQISGICPKCFRFSNKLFGHHVFPLRWGRRLNGNGRAVLYLCGICHAEADVLLPQNRKVSKRECYEITEKWLKKADF